MMKGLVVAVGLSLVLPLCASLPVGAQSEMGADQSAFSDDAELLQIDNAQVQALQAQENAAEQQAQADEMRDSTYRLYAQKKIEQLQKMKNGANDKQLQALQNWLKADTQMRIRDMQQISALRQRIANLEKTSGATMANLSGDVHAMRDAANEARADVKFNQQMQINYFNELQTEMGANNWNTPNARGAAFSTGGMGFNGGQQLFGGGY